MEKLHLESPWEEVKEKIMEINPELSDEDLAYKPGSEEDLISRLSKKMNRSRSEITGWIESVSATKRISS